MRPWIDPRRPIPPDPSPTLMLSGLTVQGVEQVMLGAGMGRLGSTKHDLSDTLESQPRQHEGG